MKKYLLLIFAFLSLTLLAQNSGGPGPYGYSWYNSDHATNPAYYSWDTIEAIENYVEMRDLVAQKEFIHEKKIANKLSERCPGRFIPRYNMVSFTSIPYSEVYKRGKIQKKIISKLDIENPDLKMAEIMIQQKLHPIK